MKNSVKKKQSKSSSSKKKKNRWWQIVLAVVVIIVSLLIMKQPKIKQQSVPKLNKSAIPAFKKEGELTFYNFKTDSTINTIDIEIADGPYETERGLMYRTTMKENRGMLFIMEKVKPQYFWMKNTYISLDIIFLDKNLKIVTIQKYTQPLSEYSIPSDFPAKYVIETNAGFCDKFGIVEGDFVKFKRIVVGNDS